MYMLPDGLVCHFPLIARKQLRCIYVHHMHAIQDGETVVVIDFRTL